MARFRSNNVPFGSYMGREWRIVLIGKEEGAIPVVLESHAPYAAVEDARNMVTKLNNGLHPDCSFEYVAVQVDLRIHEVI